MSRKLAQQIYTDVFAAWPKQALRPDHQLQDILGKAAQERGAAATPKTETDELLKARALQYLLNDKYNQRYKIQEILEPKSQPTYFQDLVKELDEAPSRSWFQRMGKRLSGMIRLE